MAYFISVTHGGTPMNTLFDLQNRGAELFYAVTQNVGQTHPIVIGVVWSLLAMVALYFNHWYFGEPGWTQPIRNFTSDLLDYLPGGLERRIARAKSEIPDGKNIGIYGLYGRHGASGRGDLRLWNGAELHAQGNWEEYVKTAYKGPWRFWRGMILTILFAPITVPIVIAIACMRAIVLLVSAPFVIGYK